MKAKMGIHKKVAAVIAAAMTAILAVASIGVGMTTSTAANAADNGPTETVTIMSYVTTNGMPDGKILTEYGAPRSIASKDTTEGDFKVLVNPTEHLAVKPGQSGMLIDLVNYDANGNDIHKLISLNPADNGNKTDSYAVGDLQDAAGAPDTDEDENGVALGGAYEQFKFVPLKNADGSIQTVPASDIVYNEASGELSFNAKYQSYADINIYNYLSKGQINETHNVYGVYTLDNEEKSFAGRATIAFNNDATYGDSVAYLLGTNMGGATEPVYNAIQSEMPVLGGSQLWMGYSIKSLDVLAASVKDGKVINTYPLIAGEDYLCAGDGTINIQKNVTADNIIIVSKVETKENLVSPKLTDKSSTSLSYKGVAGYTYKLYDKDKKLIQTKTSADVKNGVVKFTGLEDATRYYVQYVSPRGEASKLTKAKTASEYVPFDFGFKEGDTFSVAVYVGDHYNGSISVEGTSKTLGSTHFDCTVVNYSGPDAIKPYVMDKYFIGNCAFPGKGYSTGHTKWATGKVLWVNNTTREAKFYIEMNGAWNVGGRKIQNIVGNISASEPRGSVEIQKTSTDANSLNNPYYNFDGITYSLAGENKGETYDIILDESGYGRVDNVVPDTYEVEETDTNEWYQLNEETYDVVVDSKTTNDYSAPVRVKNNLGEDQLKDEPTYVELDLTKQSANPSITDHNTGIYDVRGAEYTISCTTPLKELLDMNNVKNWLPQITDKAGTVMVTSGDSAISASAHSGKLLYGDYEVRETKDGKAFAIDPTVYVIGHDKFTIGESYHITKADAQNATSEEKEELTDNPDVDFSSCIQKNDDLNHDKYGEGKADLSAVFEVRYYNTNDANYDSSKPFDTWYIRTDKNGYGDLDFIKDNPVVSGTKTEQGMSDAYSYSQNPANNGRYYTKEDKDGNIHVVMPVGYVEIQEVVAPNGYLFDTGSPFGPGKVYKYRNNELVLSEGEHVVLGQYDTNRAEENDFGTVEEHIYRSDIQIQKKRGDNSANLGMIPFVIESKTTGERHLIVTNDNGYYTSESYQVASQSRRDGYPHNRYTNYNDQFLAYTESGQPYITDESKLRYDVGTFFYGYGPNSEKDNTATTEMKETDGAFPYDEYTITEVRVANNEGLQLNIRDFTVNKSNVLAATFDIDDFPVRIHTNATDANTNDHAGLITGDTVTIKDEVSYEGLKEDTTYTMTGTLMNKATGEPLTDADGNKFVVSKEFKTPKGDTQGTVTLVFTVPATVMQGTSTVVFESCTLDGVEVGVHADIEDEGQTVTYPSVHTTATDSVTGDHEGNLLDETVTVVDAVKCNGLIAGKEYKIEGVLMDRGTGNKLVDENGGEFHATATFTATDTEQTVELRFEVPRKVIAGKTVVAFEDLYHNGIVIGTHADINDEEQTVYYPALRTTATDSVTKDHEGLANETVTINDLVEYENLIKGETYTISGKIMDKATGEALKGADGKEFTASATFVAGVDDKVAEANELVSVYLEVAGKVLDIYKNMSDDEKAAYLEKIDGTELPEFPTIAELKALVDEACTDGSDVLKEDKEMLENLDKFYLSLTDEQKKETTELVSVEKLFGAVDTLADASKDAADKDDEAEETGKPERVSGSVIVSFQIPGDIVRGKTTVVFEDLYFGDTTNDENKKAKHEDINDEGQTVVYPEIHTTATIGGEKVAPARDIIVITDTITYTNLTPGKEYTFKGVLMDKETNETVKNEDGSEVRAETTFTPETPDGTVDVEFSFNAMAIQFHDVVVFEEGWRDSDVADELILVAEHKDINDADQTVRIDDAGLADELIETGELPQAGDIVVYVLVSVAFLAGCYAIAYRHRKRNLID